MILPKAIKDNPMTSLNPVGSGKIIELIPNAINFFPGLLLLVTVFTAFLTGLKSITLWLNSFLVGVPLLVFIRPLSFSFVGLLACCICML